MIVGGRRCSSIQHWGRGDSCGGNISFDLSSLSCIEVCTLKKRKVEHHPLHKACLQPGAFRFHIKQACPIEAPFLRSKQESLVRNLRLLFSLHMNLVPLDSRQRQRSESWSSALLLTSSSSPPVSEIRGGRFSRATEDGRQRTIAYIQP